MPYVDRDVVGAALELLSSGLGQTMVSFPHPYRTPNPSA